MSDKPVTICLDEYPGRHFPSDVAQTTAVFDAGVRAMGQACVGKMTVGMMINVLAAQAWLTGCCMRELFTAQQVDEAAIADFTRDAVHFIAWAMKQGARVRDDA